MDSPLTFVSHVGTDGMVRFEAATGLFDIDVLVTLKPVGDPESRKNTNRGDWHDFVNRTYGSLAHVEDFEEPSDPPAEPLDFSL